MAAAVKILSCLSLDGPPIFEVGDISLTTRQGLTSDTGNIIMAIIGRLGVDSPSECASNLLPFPSQDDPGFQVILHL